MVEPDPEPAPSADDLDLDKLNQIWPTVLEALRASASGPTASYFEGTRPISAGGGKVEIGFPPEASFNRRNAEKPERREQLTAALLAVTGEQLEVAYGDLDGEASAGDSIGAGHHGRRRRVRRKAQIGIQRRGGHLVARKGMGGMPGGMDMNALLKQAQQMQTDMMQAQEALKDEEVEASAGGGMVKVTITGDLVIKDVTIDPDAVDPEDVDMLADMVQAAVNEAVRSAQELAASKMPDMPGMPGMGGPGLPGG